jgi:multiple sugar transport system substrate-binding protein
MVMEGNWVIQYLLDSYPDLKWGVSELPKSPNGGEATMLYSVCYGVRGIDNQHPEESWRLANFLTGNEGQMMVATAGFGALPGRLSASEAWSENAAQKITEAGLTDLAAQMSVFPTSAEYGHAWRLPAGWNAFATTFNASLQEAYTGNKLAEDVLADVSAVAEELIAKAQ